MMLSALVLFKGAASQSCGAVFAEVSVESGTEGNCDSSAYSTDGYVVDECYDSGAGITTLYAMASCDDTDGIVLNIYGDDSDCSGNATSSSIIYSEATACTTISCSGGGGGVSSAASGMPILTAFAMMAAIAAIAM